MSKNGGFDNIDQPPPYPPSNTGFSNQYGADFGSPKGGAYPPAGGAYPQTGGAYPANTGGYTQQGGAYAPGYGQTYGQQTTTAVIVSQPGAPGQVIARPRPPDYMAASVIACLCCFWPTGLCAIYYASQVNSAVAGGDMETATRYSNNARNLMISSVVIGIIWIALVIVLRVVLYSNSSSDSSYSY